MNCLIENKKEEIIRLCQRYQVRRLELFGSAVTNDFDPRTSDLDFLVEFNELPSGQYADAYFGLREALQELFQRPIDLVMPRAVKNVYFLRTINSSKTLLYAA